MQLRDMLKAGAQLPEISDWLDRASSSQRLEAAFELGRGGQRSLYRLAEAAQPITLEHFVPEEMNAVEPVHHRGRNTLPLPPKHRLFEKRFCRPRDGSARLFGYNQSPSRKLIGPGYFVARSTEKEPAWKSRGAIVVDYFQVPDGEVPTSWPEVVPNTKGLQRFVFKGTRDFMRRVSNHVSIGAAYKGEKALDHYFILVREI